ncbi:MULTISPECIES: hypothetical protein [unclassified Desulfovibrio]|uniref:hypothetical protein n=1 Tax=unclassified Desulfovibrio TaxID=2593640 RepID=UPI002FD8AE07
MDAQEAASGAAIFRCKKALTQSWLFEQLNTARLQIFFPQIRRNILPDIPGTSRNAAGETVFSAEKNAENAAAPSLSFSHARRAAHLRTVSARFAVCTVTHILVHCSPCTHLAVIVAKK